MYANATKFLLFFNKNCIFFYIIIIIIIIIKSNFIRKIMSKNILTCNLCRAIGGADSVTHDITCIYKNHITYKKENENESETIIEYNNQERQLKMKAKLKLKL